MVRCKQIYDKRVAQKERWKRRKGKISTNEKKKGIDERTGCAKCKELRRLLVKYESCQKGIKVELKRRKRSKHDTPGWIGWAEEEEEDEGGGGVGVSVKVKVNKKTKSEKKERKEKKRKKKQTKEKRRIEGGGDKDEDDSEGCGISDKKEEKKDASALLERSWLTFAPPSPSTISIPSLRSRSFFVRVSVDIINTYPQSQTHTHTLKQTNNQRKSDRMLHLGEYH